MFSNDKNVETIAQLVEVLKHYIGLQSEYMKLDVIEKVVRLLTVITIMVVFCLQIRGIDIVRFLHYLINFPNLSLLCCSLCIADIGGFTYLGFPHCGWWLFATAHLLHLTASQSY